MLKVVKYIYYHAERRYPECHYAECRYPECHYAECRYPESREIFIVMLSAVMLSVIMLNFIMLSDIMLSVIMLSIVAPKCYDMIIEKVFVSLSKRYLYRYR
jgi:hypothetical protein